MPSFHPIYDLEKLTEEQRQEYYLEACKHFGVPPELGVLRFQYMDAGEGKANLVLYALKGASDIIRANKGIDTLSLTDKIVNGSIMFHCTGRDKTGRSEMAVGVMYIEGLRGSALDKAIMTAQTRATRRMTMQFAGGGLLDESELPQHGATTNVVQDPGLKIAPQPSVTPNTAAGKTQEPSTADFPRHACLIPTPAQLAAQNALQSVKPEVLASYAEYPGFTEVARRLLETDPIVLAADAVVKATDPKRRKREKASFNKPFSLEPVVSAPAEIAPVIEKPVIPPVIIAAGNEIVQGMVQSLKDTIEASAYPADAELAEFRSKIFKYSNEILPKAGMIPSEIAGGITMKVRAFVMSRYSTTKITTEQWKDLFDYLDSTVQEKGATALVKIIDDVVEHA